MNRPAKRRVALHVQLSTIFLLLVMAVAGAIGGYGYFTSRSMLESTTADLIAKINHDTASQINHTTSSVSQAVALLSRTKLTQVSNEKERLERLPIMHRILRSSTAIVSLYAAYRSGDFFMLRRLRSESDVKLFNAPAGTRYILQEIDRSVSPARGKFIFMDADLNILREEDKPDYPNSFDARTRSWFVNALQSGTEVISAPYAFFTTNKVGITISAAGENHEGVVAADIRLETLDELLADQKITPHTQVAVVTSDADIISNEAVDQLIFSATRPGVAPSLVNLQDSGLPVISTLAPIVRSLRAENAYAGAVEGPGGDWRVLINPIKIGNVATDYLVMAIPEQELMSTAIHQRNLSIGITLILLLAAIPITLLVARSVAKPVRALADEAEAIRRFDFSKPVEVASSVQEIDQLAGTMDGMKQTIRRFLSISEAVASEEDFDKLLPLLLSDTIAAAEAEAGVLYLLDEGKLNPAAAMNAAGADIHEGMVSLDEAEGADLIHDALRDGTPVIGRLEGDAVQTLGLTGVPDIARLSHAVAVPLLNRTRQRVGCLLLLGVDAFDTAHVAFIKALSGSAASSLETRELIKSQKALFEAFIQLIAGAIDSKSPYTGGHCERVPELTKMLADAACEQTEGPFAEFRLSEDDREAVHVAAWLHDCGKITTPEYVVDKATKLETIYDRIHEVRMRFEVLKRDAEIACLKAIAGGESEATARERLAQELHTLDEEYAFVATCNEGGEFMAPEKVERLKAIAARTWLRTIDDRTGISYEERERKARVPAQPLPATERLLDDKPEHIFERPANARIGEDNPYGFRMKVPELLYNKGELYNLAISRGTLTDEDRYKINEHIVQTVIMLSNLPFPKHMRGVPEIAGGHHEKMDGTGYPKRLARDEMSPVARMMAIADVFEALTATDRPYKKGKTLSEAIKIMSFMKKDKHIDPDLFDLFLRSGVYRHYAERFMRREQIDEVDVASYLAPPPAAKPA